ncbi:MAG TPA: LLM class flavin-dependent oxidoreductase [Minicystis sp.]|nr:LLM class flavin-dependent oxidoreductase [Minicystis sp.]
MPALSVLDLSPIPAGASARDALANTVRLAELAESIGARRYWLAEHHNAASLASSAPEVLIARVAAATRTLRVGSGGIMLPNHAALKVAETFRVLEALFPGRIDLGLGRAPGTDPRTARALRRGVDVRPEEFAAQLDELVTYLDDDEVPRPPRPTSTVAIPVGVAPPEVFLLSSSDYGAAVAGERGLGFAFAHHMNPEGAAGEIARYRRAFRPSKQRPRPYAIASIGVVCGETDAVAEELASSGRLALVRMMQGQRDLPLPSVDEARAHPFDDEERAVLAAFEARAIVGGPARVGERLAALVDETGADELMVTTMVHDHAARCRSYALLADVVASLDAPFKP